MCPSAEARTQAAHLEQIHSICTRARIPDNCTAAILDDSLSRSLEELAQAPQGPSFRFGGKFESEDLLFVWSDPKCTKPTVESYCSSLA